MQVNRVSITLLTLVVAVLFVNDSTEAQAPRALAPGVLKRIDIELDARDSHTLPMLVPGLKANQYQPKTLPAEMTLYGKGHRAILYREFVWEYEFSLLGLRQAKLRVPREDGQLVDKNFWYMIYRIRDTQKTMSFKAVKQQFDHVKQELQYGVSVKDKIEFNPRFKLSGWVETKEGFKQVTYPSSINPVALYRIQQLEDPNQRLLDEVQMAKANIPVAKSDSDPGVWGVAVWEDVNPNLDFVNVQVKGLSNAYRLNRKKLDDPAKMKTLQLNFWRPGDVVAEKRDNIQFGIPLVDQANEQIEICKRYALPGPVIRVFEQDKLAEREVLIAEVDAEIDLDDLKSKVTPILDQGKLPKSLISDLERSGVTVDQNAALTTVVDSSKWKFNDSDREFIVVLTPRVWEPRFGKIRFIKSLDHLWIYR